MFTFHSIRSRLTVTFLAIIAAVMIITSFFLYNLLERYFFNSMQDSLTRSGFEIARNVAGYLREQTDTPRLSKYAEDSSRLAGGRVIFINRQGVVIGDSVRVGGLLGQTLDREEIAMAMEGEVGSSILVSERTGQRVMQVAVPILEEGSEPLGVVFLSASLQEIYGGEQVRGILKDLRLYLLLATLVAVAVVGGGSVILARRFTGPLEVLAKAASRMGEGELDQQIKVSSRDEIGNLADQLNIMAARLNYYTSNLKHFASNVSHELRTPLASLSLITKSMKDYEMDSEQQQEFLEDMDQELDRLIALVHDLLELTKLEEGNKQYDTFCLVELLREITRQLRPRFDRQDIRLITDLPPFPVWVNGSPPQLRQAIHNLLDNALKYTSSGGWVRVSLWREKDQVTVKIEDTGSGIPETDLPNIFERFYRVDHARTREMGGTGLGLAIVKETIFSHGGRIWVESEEGKGSAFFFTLALQEDILNNN
jgi:signal transduction histidine kinase